MEKIVAEKNVCYSRIAGIFQSFGIPETNPNLPFEVLIYNSSIGITSAPNYTAESHLIDYAYASYAQTTTKHI